MERGGSLNAEEKQLAKRYAVFFRMPRLSGHSPPDLNRQARNGSTTSDRVSLPDVIEGPPKRPQPQEYYPVPSMPTPLDPASYDASMFDPQNFPQLQEEFYNGNPDIDFGFSDFFGGYGDVDYMAGTVNNRR